jgi:hypothetical protein
MLTWHLLHTVAAAPCVRMQQAADNDGVSMLQDGLEGAPCSVSLMLQCAMATLLPFLRPWYPQAPGLGLGLGLP